METQIFKSCRMAALVFLTALISNQLVLHAFETTSQSLAEIARKEAERRNKLEQQGIKGKIIEANSIGENSNGSLTTSTITHANKKTSSTQKNASRKSSSVQKYRTKLKKLDRAIRKGKERLEKLRERLRKERWAIPKSGRLSSQGQSEKERNRLRVEIEDLESELRDLRRERAEVFDEGKKVGFLPGELDGKGITP